LGLGDEAVKFREQARIFMRMILNWFLSALSLMIVAQVVRGFNVTGFKAALIAALVIGLVNATVGLFLKVVTFPLTLVSLGVFWFVINALMLELAAAFVPGFRIEGFIPAFFGAIVLSLVNLFLKMVTKAFTSSTSGDYER
jgi:putative membrane protein